MASHLVQHVHEIEVFAGIYVYINHFQGHRINLSIFAVSTTEIRRISYSNLQLSGISRSGPLARILKASHIVSY